MSHSLNTTQEYGVGIAKTVQRISTGYKVRGSNSGCSKICYLTKTCPDLGWDPPSQLFSQYDGSFLEVQQLCSVPIH